VLRDERLACWNLGVVWKPLEYMPSATGFGCFSTFNFLFGGSILYKLPQMLRNPDLNYDT
jgi:hypothetical protein